MGTLQKQFLPFLVSILVVPLFSQNNLQPIKIEEREEKYTETNSKYGTQVRTKKQLVIIYKDGSFEKATKSKLNSIFKQVPLAGLEYKKYHSNSIYMASSLPLFGVGFWGAVNVINGKDKQKNAIIGLVGLAASTTVYEIFEYRKKRNINRLIAHCNNYWKNNMPQSEIRNPITPDAIRVGLLNENTVGIGLAWYITE